MTATTIPSFATADFAKRMEVLKQIATHTGVRLPATIIPEGESLIPYGEERQRGLKDEIYSLPTIGEAYAILRDIRMEQEPMDVKVPLQQVRMSPVNAGLYGKGAEDRPALAYTATAFQQVAAAVKPPSVTAGFAPTLLALPPSIRADAFNHFAGSAIEEKPVVLRTIKSASWKQNGERSMVLRRSVNAVVSERYTVVEDHDLIATLERSLPDGARVRYTQTESRSDVEILWPAMTRQLKVGDIALISLQVTNSQTKQSSIRLSPKVLRVLCLNFTTAWSDGGEQDVSIVHMGEAKAKFAAAIRDALAVVEPFILAFGDAYNKPLPEIAPTRGEAIRRFISSNSLSDKVGTQIAAAWDADGTMSAGDTLAGLSNAATRVSQQFVYANAEPIEAAAGRLIREGWASIE
jgi:hypothetical protein